MDEFFLVKIGNVSLGIKTSSVEDVENILKYACGSYSTNDGVATQLARDTRTTVYTAKTTNSPKFTIYLSNGSWHWHITVYDSLNRHVYSGDVVGFSKKVSNTNWNEFKDKIVKLTYNGGTDYGGERLVKVREYDGTHLKCTDLEKEQPRNYFVSKISKIRVVG